MVAGTGVRGPSLAVEMAALPLATKQALLAEVAKVSSKVYHDNKLPKYWFFAGVINTIAKVYTLGAAPQYLWLYAMIEWPLLFSFVFINFYRTKELMYMAELCWVLNIVGWVLLAVEVILTAAGSNHWGTNPETRLMLGRAFFTLANGPLGLSVIILNNCVVFHDIALMAAFFIHFTPALVSWTFRWHLGQEGCDGTSDDVTLGCVFSVHNNDSVGDQMKSLYGLPILIYMCWWLVYTLWLCSFGYDMPNRGYGSSSFNDIKPVARDVFKVPDSHPRCQAFTYTFLHGVGCAILMLLPILLYQNFVLHTIFLCLLVVVAVFQGANYYHVQTGEEIEKALHKELKGDLSVDQSMRAFSLSQAKVGVARDSEGPRAKLRTVSEHASGEVL